MTLFDNIKEIAASRSNHPEATVQTLKSMGVTDRILKHLNLPSFEEMLVPAVKAITVYEVRVYNTVLNFWYSLTVKHSKTRAEQVADKQKNLGYQSEVVAVVVD